MPFLYEDQITFEKSSSYFRSDEVPSRIYNYNQNIKLIVVICNPVSRAITQYADELTRENVTFEEKDEQMSENFKKLIFDKNGFIKKNLTSDDFINPGRYVIHLKRWLKFFPLENILILDGENLFKKPYEEVKNVEKFLNSTSYIQKQHFVLNKNNGNFCIKKNLNTTELNCIESSRRKIQPYIKPNVVSTIKDYFEPFDKEFFKIIKKQPFW